MKSQPLMVALVVLAAAVTPCLAEDSTRSESSMAKAKNELARMNRQRQVDGCYWETEWKQEICRHPDQMGIPDSKIYLNGETIHMRDEPLARIRIRCEYKAQNYWVNDALRTRNEIFAECMRSEIWIAGH